MCNKILREDNYKLNWPKTFGIMDQKDQIHIVREIAKDLNLTMTDMIAKDYLDKIEKEKIADRSYVDLITGSENDNLRKCLETAPGDYEKVKCHYLLKQCDNFLMDFTDMIEFVLYIFRKFPEIRRKWQERCQYVLCDEFQDVSYSQMKLLDLLSGLYKNLFVVGDDDQLIYGWRTARPEYMLNFVDAHHGCRDFYLMENFRSTPEIVAVANSLISRNQNRITKQMYTNNPSGDKPAYFLAKTEKDEAEWIAKTIKEQVSAGKRYIDHAVLVRASSQTRALEEAFVEKAIPYKIYSGARFYETEEIKTTLSYLRMVYSLTDLDFEQTINRPRRQFGKKSLSSLKEYAKEKNIHLIDALGEQIDAGIIKKTAVIEYYQAIMHLHESYRNFSVTDLTGKVLDIGYRKALQEDVDQTRLDNVTELVHTIASLEGANAEPVLLEDLLAHFALFSSQDEDSDAKNVVKVMTIHTAKGLEFPTVFVNGLVENLFPSKRLKNQDEMEEERRVFYVAITRAKETLFLSSYAMKNEHFPCTPSRFIGNIAPVLLEFLNGVPGANVYSYEEMFPETRFQEGDRIFHNVFGEGEIVKVNEESRLYEILFDIFPVPRKIQFRAGIVKVS